MDFVLMIYKHIKSFSSDEKFGLINQTNDAEGASKNSNKDYLCFLYISRGGLSDLATQLLISKNLEYLTPEDFEETQ